jgi:hypothetical protein
VLFIWVVYADRTAENASLIVPTPSIYEFSGTYLNYEFLMQIYAPDFEESLFFHMAL